MELWQIIDSTLSHPLIDIAFFCVLAIAIFACFKKVKARSGSSTAYKHYLMMFFMIAIARFVQIVQRPFAESLSVRVIATSLMVLIIATGAFHFYLGCRKLKELL